MSKFCKHCGIENRGQSRFCKGCGKELSSAETPQPATQAMPLPPPAQKSLPLETKPKPKRRILMFLLPALGLLVLLASVAVVIVQGDFFDRDQQIVLFDENSDSTEPVDEELIDDAVTVVAVATVNDVAATAVATAVVAVEPDVIETVSADDDRQNENVTETATATPLPTEEPPDVLVESEGLRVTMEKSAETGIRVEIRFADSSPKEGNWVGIFSQTSDVSGNPTFDARVAADRTSQTGAVFFVLPPDEYAIQLGDLIGGSWGNNFNYKVVAGNTTVVSLTLGELVIGVRNSEEQPMEGKYTGVFLQANDVNNKPAKADRLSWQRTSAAGITRYPIVAGTYAIEVGDIWGEPWGAETGHVVEAGKTSEVVVTLGRIEIGVENALGEPVEGRYVAVLRQVPDVQGNPAKGERINGDRTNTVGLRAWDITAGMYAVEIGDVIGELWGIETNHVVVSNETTEIRLALGRLRVGLQDIDGNPIEGRRVGIFFQVSDINGNPTYGDRIADGRTDNRGLIEWDVTAGTYIVGVDELNALTDVVIEAGQITITDGLAWDILEE